jgi:ribosomal protein S18 acetylase RimI-like enzyme
VLGYVINGPVTSEELNALFSAGGPEAGWPSWQASADTSDWQPVLDHCLVHITARDNGRLVGFVHVAWDGRDHAFLLDPRVDPGYRHQRIGLEMVRLAARQAAKAGCEVLHVDYEAELAPFYDACGFKPTAAGLIRLA